MAETLRFRCTVARFFFDVYQRAGAWLHEKGYFSTWIGQRILDVLNFPSKLCDGKCDGGCD